MAGRGVAGAPDRVHADGDGDAGTEPDAVINRLIERAIRGGKRTYAWLQRHERLRPVLGFLRKHWPETLALSSLVALIAAVDPPKLARVFARAEWQPIALMVPVVVLSYVCRGLAWWVTLRRIGERIGVLRCLGIEFAGQVMVFLPLGDLARVAMVRGTEDDVGAGPITGTVAFQELTFMMLLGLGVLPRVVSEPGVAGLAALMVLVHVVIFLILSWQPLYSRARRWVERIRVLRRFDKQLRELRPAFMKLWEVKAAASVFTLQGLAAVLNYVLFFLALRAMGVHGVTVVESAYVLGLAYILSGLSLIPGGLGAFEGIVTLLLVSHGVPAATGAAASLLYRGFNDVLVAILGVPFAVHVRRVLSRPQGDRGTRRKRRPDRGLEHRAETQPARHRATGNDATTTRGPSARRSGRLGARSSNGRISGRRR